MSVRGVQAKQQDDSENLYEIIDETNESVMENPGYEEVAVVRTYLRIHTSTQHTEPLNEPTETSLGQTQPAGSAVDEDNPSDETPHLMYNLTKCPAYLETRIRGTTAESEGD